MNPGRKCFSGGVRPTGLFITLSIVTLTLLLAWPRTAQAAGTWSQTGYMTGTTPGRSLHTATLLTDSRVLAVGGRNSDGNAVRSSTRFDPATGTWSNAAWLNNARYMHTATRLNTDWTLVAGGIGAGGTTLASAELYNPTTETWTDIDSMSTPRRNHTATLRYGSMVLVIGGEDDSGALASTEYYHVVWENWNSLNPMTYARTKHTATDMTDGNILVAGGQGADTPWLDNVEIFNTATGSWTGAESLHHPRNSHTATRLKDGRILVVGGYGVVGAILTSAELYDPAANTWDMMIGELAQGRYNHTATLLPDGRVLVAGGIGQDAEGMTIALDSAEIYNPATGNWSAADSLATARYAHTGTLLRDGRVLVAGGGRADGTSMTSAAIYDPFNFVRNCSFETASVDPGAHLLSGSTDIAHWTVGDDGIDYRGDWQAAEGRCSLDLNYLGAGSIRTYFSTTSVGKLYLLTFAMAGNPGGVQGIKTLRVTAGDQSREFYFDTTGKSADNMGWTSKSMIFKSNNPLTLLRFSSLTDGVFGPALDKVRVIRFNPPPPMMLLLN
jgi:choice-of-anchor C domain-containing protein